MLIRGGARRARWASASRHKGRSQSTGVVRAAWRRARRNKVRESLISAASRSRYAAAPALLRDRLGWTTTGQWLTPPLRADGATAIFGCKLRFDVQQGGQNRTRVGHIGVVEELERAGGMAAAVAIGGHHDDRQVGRLRFDSRSKVSSFIPGVLMSDRRSAPAGPHSIASRGERSEEPTLFADGAAKKWPLRGSLKVG
jgi:hypothetical protein